MSPGAVFRGSYRGILRIPAVALSFCNTAKALESIPVPILKRYPANPDQLRLDAVQVGYFPFIQQATAVVQVLIPEDGNRIPRLKEQSDPFSP